MFLLYKTHPPKINFNFIAACLLHILLALAFYFVFILNLSPSHSIQQFQVYKPHLQAFIINFTHPNPSPQIQIPPPAPMHSPVPLKTTATPKTVTPKTFANSEQHPVITNDQINHLFNLLEKSIAQKLISFSQSKKISPVYFILNCLIQNNKIIQVTGVAFISGHLDPGLLNLLISSLKDLPPITSIPLIPEILTTRIPIKII